MTSRAIHRTLRAKGVSFEALGRELGVTGKTAARWIRNSSAPAKAATVIARKIGSTRAAVWPQRFGSIKASAGEPTGPTYEGTSQSRRLGSWGLSNAGPNAEMLYSLPTLRSRSREAFRNNGWARRAAYSYAANAIGTGINPRWRAQVKDLKPTLQKVYRRWGKQADADGLSDINGLLGLGALTQFLSGEVLVRFRPRRLNDQDAHGNPLVVPLQLQLLEPDHLDVSRDGTVPNTNGNVIRAGIEFDQIGRRVAYWLLQNHPGEFMPMSGNSFSYQTIRVPADQVLHVFARERPGQIRGVPRLASTLLTLYDIDRYEDSENVRKRAASAIGGFITRSLLPDGTTANDNPFGNAQGTDPFGQAIAYLEPGSFPFLPPGTDVKTSQPADSGPGAEAWIRGQLRKVASGALLTYEQLTGDLSNVNYSSIRAGLVEIRRMLEAVIYNVFVFQFCDPVAARWLDFAVASGAIDIPNYAERRADLLDIDWRPQKWAFVDPVKDVLGTQMQMRSGLLPRQDAVAEMGEDAEDLDARYAEDNERSDAFGLVFDSDPRQTNLRGGSQTQQQATAAQQAADAAAGVSNMSTAAIINALREAAVA